MDGLKGIAAILIFVHHFCLIFYPAIHFGDAVLSKLYNLDTVLSQSPFSVFLNGNFLVAIFCTISGAVISIQIMELPDKNKLADIIMKRYFRLMLPVVPVGLLIFVMLRYGLFSNQEAAVYTQSPWAAMYYQSPMTFFQTLRSVFVDTWFWGDDTLSTAFWMLSQLFYGTFLSIILSIVCWKYKKHTWSIYVMLAFVFFNHGTLQLAFILGTLLTWLCINCSQCFNKYLGCILFTIGIFLGGYPSGVTPTNVYRLFCDVNYIDVHIVGAFFTLYGIWSLEKLQAVLSMPIFKGLGKISYSIYLIHIPLLFSFSTSLFLFVKEYMRYAYSAGLSLFVSIFVLIMAANMYNKTIENMCVQVQRKILAWFTA